MYEESRTYVTTTRAEYTPYEIHETAGCGPQLDLDYLRTLPGMLKLIEITMCFLCFLSVLVGGPAYFHGVSFATFVSVFGFSISLILLILYLFHVVDQFQHLPIIVTEMIYCFIWTIFFFIVGSIFALASAKYSTGFFWAIAAIWAFGALMAYGIDCYLKFLAWKHNEYAQGGRNTFTTHAPQTV
uniref:MARVEL domain-containing protein n=1 Tax=Panagrolaimus sp. PS1159 TaxID=55785 RepID=A0AC35GGD6_9BILA